jgi:hypothetical protein
MGSKTTNSSQRRSGRIARQLPIQVSGIDAMGRDFTTPAHTLVLSRYGAEILLKTELVPEQEISIGLMGNVRDWDARIVGLYSKRPEGFAYGVEFLFQDGNFWGISFPALPGPARTTADSKRPAGAAAAKAENWGDGDLDFEAMLKKVRKASPAKTYAIRLKCQYLEAHAGIRPGGGGDDDQWLILQDRHESLQQVLETPWDFTCPIHGAQREYPLEAKETDAGFQIRLAESVSKDVNGQTGIGSGVRPAPKARRERRDQQNLRVSVRGIDLNGNTFRQSAQSLDISRNGAKLDGLGLLTLPGTTIEVRHHWRRALFRVVWTGKRGTAQASHVGIVCLEPGKNVWNFPEGN